ncbi:MAG: hypothetical protein KDI01_00275 [Halioglobus sp.]|nr:hypothetical protein [Halioglobus sp.]
MKPTRTHLILTAAAGLALAAQQSAAGTPCHSSATLMSRSCKWEAGEEFNATMANCSAIESQAERRACKVQARSARSEALETCSGQQEARNEVCADLGEVRYRDPLTDSGIAFIDPDEIGDTWPNNPYVILQAGHTHVLRSEDEIVVVYATDEVRDIQGVSCRVVADVVVEEEFDEEEMKWEYTAVEVTDDWFAQDSTNNVYYCGEVARNYEDGVLRDLDGSFEAGREWASGGLLTLASPVPGQAHRQEYALGEAEDIVAYLATDAVPSADEGGENPGFPCEAAGGCLKTFDSSPLEPESTEYKYYLAGTGFVLAVSLEDGEIVEGGREELICRGDSLDILHNADCAIEDPDELLDELCDLHDEFCNDDDD